MGSSRVPGSEGHGVSYNVESWRFPHILYKGEWEWNVLEGSAFTARPILTPCLLGASKAYTQQQTSWDLSRKEKEVTSAPLKAMEWATAQPQLAT